MFIHRERERPMNKLLSIARTIARYHMNITNAENAIISPVITCGTRFPGISLFQRELIYCHFSLFLFVLLKRKLSRTITIILSVLIENVKIIRGIFTNQHASMYDLYLKNITIIGKGKRCNLNFL